MSGTFYKGHAFAHTLLEGTANTSRSGRIHTLAVYRWHGRVLPKWYTLTMAAYIIMLYLSRRGRLYISKHGLYTLAYRAKQSTIDIYHVAVHNTMYVHCTPCARYTPCVYAQNERGKQNATPSQTWTRYALHNGIIIHHAQESRPRRVLVQVRKGVANKASMI